LAKAFGSWLFAFGFGQLAISQEKTAANFANEHESKTKNMIRVFRVDSRLISFLSAPICGNLRRCFFG
jgi:hypothetical protein